MKPPSDLESVQKQLAQTANDNDPYTYFFTCSCTEQLRDGKDCSKCEFYISENKRLSSYSAVGRCLNKWKE